MTIFCSMFAAVALAGVPAVTPAPRENLMDRHERHMVLARAGGAPIVFLGDSITQHWNRPDMGLPVWNRFFKEGALKAVNLGIGGDRTEHVLWRVQNGELDGFEAKLVILEVGINNIGQRPGAQEPAADTLAGIRAVLDEVRRRQPRAKVVLHPIFSRAAGESEPADVLQRRADAVNSELYKFCDGITVFWCDFNDRLTTADGHYPSSVAPDGLHPLTIGYEIWAAEILPYARAAAAGTDMPPSRFATRLLYAR